MTEPTFGITITRDDSEARPVSGADFSVLGMVGPAPEADAAAFPLDTPVLIVSSDAAMLAKLGAGEIAEQITLLDAQLADYQTSAKIVFVRTAAGQTEAETIANIIGNEANRTGLFALLLAGPMLGAIPRLVVVPGYTHQIFAGIDHATIVGGQDYTSAPAVSFTGGSMVRPAVATATVSNGALTGIAFSDHGEYLSTPTIVLTGGGGTGASATAVMEQLENPVCAILPGILSKLIAHAVVEGPGTNSIADKDWRETIASGRLIAVDTWAKTLQGVDIVSTPGVGAVLGIAVRRDYENRGVPSKSWANQPVHGIIGPNRFVDFSLTDGATEAQDLLMNNIGVLVRGQLGVETAIADSGFVFIGTDNCNADPLWQFYNVSRMRDYIHLGLLKTLRYYLGRHNITRQTVQSIENVAHNFLRDLVADGDILPGFKVGFEASKNSPDNIRLGRIRIFFACEEPPVLRRIDIDSRRSRASLDILIADIASDAANLV